MTNSTLSTFLKKSSADLSLLVLTFIFVQSMWTIDLHDTTPMRTPQSLGPAPTVTLTPLAKFNLPQSTIEQPIEHQNHGIKLSGQCQNGDSLKLSFTLPQSKAHSTILLPPCKESKFTYLFGFDEEGLYDIELSQKSQVRPNASEHAYFFIKFTSHSL